jgi:hypothetical protein
MEIILTENAPAPAGIILRRSCMLAWCTFPTKFRSTPPAFNDCGTNPKPS